VVPVEEHRLPIELKSLLAKRYWEQDGSLKGGPTTLTSADIAYLSGLSDAGIKGADELIEAINKYEAVEIFIEE
jgi:hypothetical protein